MAYCRNCGSQLREADNFCETCGTARKKVSSKATFTGKTCPYCQFPIKQVSEIVLCPSCKVPHHRECWEQNGDCTTFGCRGLCEVVHKYKCIDPDIIASLDADYYIDYTLGTSPIGDLPIGARVIDLSWEWKFRTGRGYARESGDETRSVTWIVVAKNHYEGLNSHVTLLTEEMIGRFTFDNSTDRGSQYGSNHWGKSGKSNASRGLRPWLNSIDIHSSEGFYRAFSEGFKHAVLTTAVPNREWKNGSVYSTSDNVFIPSTTEVDDTNYIKTYKIGTVYAYFQVSTDAKRIAKLGENTRWYWTRSPSSFGDGSVRGVSSAGAFGSRSAYRGHRGVRPALNLKSETLVSEIPF